MSKLTLNVILFGTGECARRGFERFKDRCSIKGFCDNNPKKQGQMFCGKPVYSPAEFAELEFDRIIICSMYHKEILAQLQDSLGIPRSRIMIFDLQESVQETANFIDSITQVRTSNKDLIDHCHEVGFRPGCVIDVGVAFGTPELYRHCRQDVPIVLIEPIVEFEPNVAKILTSRNATVHWAAASDTDGTLDIWVTPDMTTSSLHIPMNVTQAAVQRSVPSYKLDTLMKNGKWPGPYLLKVDVQGAELNVLDGACELLNDTELLLLEVALFKFSPGIPDFYEVIDYMKQRGFVVYDVFNGHNRPLDFARAQVDVAFVKEDGFFRHDVRWGTSEQCQQFVDCKFTRDLYRNLNPAVHFAEESKGMP